MAGRGPAPKDPSKRRRRNASDPETVLHPDDELRGPELPEGVLGDDADGNPNEWHPMTQLWWDSWRTSAQAQTFTATDWLFLIDTALMHHTMWARGRWEFASEVRLRAAKFGATPEDRARLKLKVDDPAVQRTVPNNVAAAGNVTDITSRKARLTG
ncbi:phage terminase small subunit [Streptomyces hydrogenans]|uniref:phage terminase small subunit n=1 Tax=Streptomyces hydrogenans TaxID=1873719 RepID=UPI0035DAB114